MGAHTAGAPISLSTKEDHPCQMTLTGRTGCG
jgi:hypothetical protein